ncbi:MAG: transposase [Caldimonas sp.]
MHPKSGFRRRHSDELKAQVLAACDVPGASISGVALTHGLNTNLVRKWRSGRGVKRSDLAIPPAAPNMTPPPPPPLRAAPEFIAIEMPAPPKAAARVAAGLVDTVPTAEPLIHIELRRGPLHLNVRWPTSAADDATAWLRELSAGLLK